MKLNLLSFVGRNNSSQASFHSPVTQLALLSYTALETPDELVVKGLQVWSPRCLALTALLPQKSWVILSSH